MPISINLIGLKQEKTQKQSICVKTKQKSAYIVINIFLLLGFPLISIIFGFESYFWYFRLFFFSYKQAFCTYLSVPTLVSKIFANPSNINTVSVNHQNTGKTKQQETFLESRRETQSSIKACFLFSSFPYSYSLLLLLPWLVLVLLLLLSYSYSPSIFDPF